MDASLLMVLGGEDEGGPSRADGIYSAKRGKALCLPGQTGGSEMKSSRTMVGVDTAKRVFHLHWVDMETGEIRDLRLTRGKFLEHFANRAPCIVGMEACGGSQHWARRLIELGHEVRLLPAKMVRPFVPGNKSDVHDARAIWTAMQQPGIKTVSIKSEEQQAILALHRMRQQLVKFRTAQINALRGLFTEYGEIMPQGRAGLRRDLPLVLSNGLRIACRRWSWKRCVSNGRGLLDWMRRSARLSAGSGCGAAIMPRAGGSRRSPVSVC